MEMFLAIAGVVALAIIAERMGNLVSAVKRIAAALEANDLEEDDDGAL